MMIKINRILLLALAMATAIALPAQYTLDEFGVQAGPGFALFTNSEAALSGPAAQAGAFFSHYACGKAYGFHVAADATFSSTSTADGDLLFATAGAGATSINMLGMDLGFYGKIRPKEYHRPSEIALLLGPKFQIPLMGRYASENASGSLGDLAESRSPFVTTLHVSVLIRRPASKKKSWFIHPGVEYAVLPAFSGGRSGDVRPLYFFLNFGYAFWDKRG